MHSLDWNDLRYFLAVHRAGSLAGAARSLRVRHSTVGRRIEALESGLEVRLFTRTPDGFLLTDSGTEILPLAEDAERALTAIERRVAGTDDRAEGTVRLATSEAFSGFLVRHLGGLHTRYPGLIVEVLSGNRSLDLSRGEADVALRFSATTQPDLICKCIGETGWALFASETYLARRGAPAPATDLSGHDVIAFDSTMANTPGALWINDHAAGAHVVMRGNSIMSALNAAVAGMGLAVLPCFLAEAEPTLRRVASELVGSREVWLVFQRDVARTARVRCVIDFLTELIAASATELRGTTGARVPSATATP
ncbi:MAG: LysR family transcriptional regulator [Bauldia sp.]